MKQLITCMLLLISYCSIPQLVSLQPNVSNGGRAVAVTRHPSNNNEIVIASETGGLFRSANSGVNWTQISGSTIFSYNDVLYYPPTPSTIIATAGQDTKNTNGGGIWRSTNNGVTWSRVSVTPPVSSCAATFTCYGISFEPGANRIWVGTSCGLASSTDGGATFTFVPTSTNYNNDRVFAVLSPTANNIKILTDAGVKVSTNGGTSWTVSGTGLPGWYVEKGIHNQIAVSPFNHQHIFWAFNWYDTQWHNALYMSANNGSTWTAVVNNNGKNRAPFVRIANSLTGTASQFDVYFCDGGCTFQRATFSNGTTPAISGTWANMTVDHCDGADVAFRTDNKTPLVFLSDGGIHTTTNSGSTWTFNGGGTKGYNALQITEVTGQKHGGNSKSDLYFATQDNNIWSSPDEGLTWPNSVCCEGFFLNIPRQALSAADTKFTLVDCAPCGNFISGPLLSGMSGFANAPGNAGNPRLLDPGDYVQNTQISGLTANIFNFTSNNGGAWVPKYGFAEEVRDFSKVSGTGAATNIFTAVRRPGSTPDGNEIIGIKRITGVLDTGTPIVSDITGFGSLGIFPTMFAWYKPFGVDVHDANHLIVPDIVDNAIKVTRDGGLTWTTDAALTNLVTEGGVYRFRWGPFTQVSNISFDPDYPGHILVGTVQSGIFRSCDNGNTWAKISGSEQVPNVSSFYFTAEAKAIASSYGRGLWKLNIERCRQRIRRPDIIYQISWPLIYYQGVWIPLKDLGNPDVCPRCTFVFINQGEIRSYSVERGSNKVNAVTISGGEMKAMDIKGNAMPLSIRSQTNAQLASMFAKDEKLSPFFKSKYKVKGIYLEGNIFKGVILAKENLSAKDLPLQQAKPNVRGELIYDGKNVKGLRLYGFGFNAQYPLQLMLDGKQLELKDREKYNDKGIFTLEVLYPFSTGGHTILITQKTDKGYIKEAYTFNVPVSDERKEKE